MSEQAKQIKDLERRIERYRKVINWFLARNRFLEVPKWVGKHIDDENALVDAKTRQESIP